MKTTYCEYCNEPRNSNGNDGYSFEEEIRFIHFYCIFRLFESDIRKKLKIVKKRL